MFLRGSKLTPEPRHTVSNCPRNGVTFETLSQDNKAQFSLKSFINNLIKHAVKW